MTISREFLGDFNNNFTNFIIKCIKLIDDGRILTVSELMEAEINSNIVETIYDKFSLEINFSDEILDAINAALSYADISHYSVVENEENGLLMIINTGIKFMSHLQANSNYLEEVIKNNNSNNS